MLEKPTFFFLWSWIEKQGLMLWITALLRNGWWRVHLQSIEGTRRGLIVNFFWGLHKKRQIPAEQQWLQKREIEKWAEKKAKNILEFRAVGCLVQGQRACVWDTSSEYHLVGIRAGQLIWKLPKQTFTASNNVKLLLINSIFSALVSCSPLIHQNISVLADEFFSVPWFQWTAPNCSSVHVHFSEHILF